MLTSVLQSAWMSLLKEVFRQLLTEKKKSGQKKKKKSPLMDARRSLFKELSFNNLKFATMKLSLIFPLFSYILTFSLI